MLVYRFAVATAVATYLLILIGGLVHGTGSSLACPDWPTCYGTLLPKMEGGVLVERANKFLAEHPASEDAIRCILTLKLATMREDGEPTRRREFRAELTRICGPDMMEVLGT